MSARSSRILTLALVGGALTACGTDLGPRPPLASSNPAVVGRSYSLDLSTHCGVLSIWFSGRPFYLDEPVPRTRDQVGLPDPSDSGTITLSSPHRAVFRDGTGHVLTFVDRRPGELHHAYTVPLRILQGGHVDGIDFNGQLWQSEGSLPESYGPPTGSVESLREVTGTVTLIDEGHAQVTYRGQVVPFVPSGPVGCA